VAGFQLSADAAQTTTNSYADALILDKRNHKTATIQIKNTGANGLHVKVLGSLGSVFDNDGFPVYDIDVVTEQTVAAGAQHVAHVTNYYPYLKVQIKAAVNGSQTNAETRAATFEH
jgi:hypothetical protein